ncbi:hypothetical protein JCM1841_004033 [Sporobolomyces salmonicolor]
MSAPSHHTHDPFKPPGGLIHLKATILWAVLPDIIIFTAFAFLITALSSSVHSLEISPTVLTVFGTIIGLLLTFRTNSAYGSYTEGRRLWSSVILASRTFGRMCWLHCPEYINVPKEPEDVSDDEKRRALIEKKTMINLVAAFSLALKHYVRGEPSIFYTDLYPLVSFLPRYRLPTSNYLRRPDLDPSLASPSFTDPSAMETLSASALASLGAIGSQTGASSPLLSRNASMVRSMSLGSSITLGASLASSTSKSPILPNTSGDVAETIQLEEVDVVERMRERGPGHERKGTWSSVKGVDELTGERWTRIVPPHKLMPSRNPPPRSIDDFIPFFDFFADLVRLVFRRTKKVANAARGIKKKRKPLQATKEGDNVPLEITMMLSAWVASLQRRKTIDVPTINALLAALQSMTDALTGLERVLLTPIPVAYSLHLRHVIWLYLLVLPSQVLATLGWLTVPCTAIATFVFLGLLRLGDEIENPLGYDDSDLDLESFTHTIVKELRELCAHPMDESDPSSVCFAEDNLPFATGPLYCDKSATQILEEQIPLSVLHEKLRHAGGGGCAEVELRTEETRGRGTASGRRPSRGWHV